MIKQAREYRLYLTKRWMEIFAGNSKEKHFYLNEDHILPTDQEKPDVCNWELLQVFIEGGARDDNKMFLSFNTSYSSTEELL